MSRRTSREGAGSDAQDGFALVAALLGLLMFAFFAYAVLAAERGGTAGVDADLERAKLQAAADAALATAVEGLGASGADRWGLDDRTHALVFDDIQTTIVVEDERGKVPLNGLGGEQARRLLAAAGVSGPALGALTDSLLNWEDGGDRADGAKRLDYAAQGVRLRNGPIRTFGEMAAIRGMDPALLDRLAPITTLFTPPGETFEPRTASPLALAVMAPSGADTPDAIIRARERAGQRAKLDTGPEMSYVGRPFTVRVTARDGRGGVYRRATVVVFTGRPRRPVWVRAVD